VIEAARVKAGHRMAFADAFAVATALAHGADLLTGDPEILRGGKSWSVVDLRS
jgi:predicted nucleic acid-binding protein